MIFVKLFLFLFFVPLALSGCDKDEEDSNIENNAELIVDKNWVLTGHTSKQNNDPVKDQFMFYDKCDTDDVYRFFKNGTFEVSEGKLNVTLLIHKYIVREPGASSKIA